jgi:hypothetical protein
MYRPVGEVLMPPILRQIDGPAVVLKGPVDGAQDWQSEAVTKLQDIEPSLVICSPRGEQDHIDPAELADWEAYYEDQAAKCGTIMIWLARQTQEISPNGGPPQPFAQNELINLGAWRAKKLHDPHINLVVGIDPEFAGAEYVSKMLEHDRKLLEQHPSYVPNGRKYPSLPVLTSLDETCEATAYKMGYWID